MQIEDSAFPAYFTKLKYFLLVFRFFESFFVKEKFDFESCLFSKELSILISLSLKGVFLFTILGKQKNLMFESFSRLNKKISSDKLFEKKDFHTGNFGLRRRRKFYSY